MLLAAYASAIDSRLYWHRRDASQTKHSPAFERLCQQALDDGRIKAIQMTAWHTGLLISCSAWSTQIWLTSQHNADEFKRGSLISPNSQFCCFGLICFSVREAHRQPVYNLLQMDYLLRRSRWWGWEVVREARCWRDNVGVRITAKVRF